MDNYELLCNIGTKLTAMKSIQYLPITFILFIMSQCSPSTEYPVVDLKLYGSNSCDHCNEFRAKLEKEEIKYTFYDVERDQLKANEMLEAVHSINYYDYISFPVVVFDKYVFINPPFEQVQLTLEKMALQK